MATSRAVPGSLYQRNGRWWWVVKLPGEDKRAARPLIVPGCDVATADKAVAQQIARRMYREATEKAATVGRVGWDGTLGCLVRMYRQHAAGYYRRPDGTQTDQVQHVDQALVPLLDVPWSSVIAAEFGPLKLTEVRSIWERQHLASPPRKQLCRTTINQRVRVIQDMFRWGVSQELVPSDSWERLRAIIPLRKHRSEFAREPRKVRAVKPRVVERTLAEMSPVLQAMVRLQMCTGMRSTELCCIKPCHIDRNRTDGWLYRVPPEGNKNDHRDGEGYERVVPIVAAAQQILAPYLDRAADTYCFTPAERDQERRAMQRAARKSKVCASWLARKAAETATRNRTAFRPRYDRESYWRAITRATKIANKKIKAEVAAMAKAGGWDAKRTAEELEARLLPHWHPHQLRHLAGTLVRARLGDEGRDAAQALLGHHQAATTERYAEVDRTLAFKAAKKLA